MSSRGYTLLELLVTLAVAVLLLTVGLPTLSQHIEKNRLEAATDEFLSAINSARTHAVMHNSRITLRAKGAWHQGWEIFFDDNHNGTREPGEELITTHSGTQSLIITGNRWVANYISFIGTGEGRRASGDGGGALLLGRLTLCAPQGRGYQLVLSRGGRTRLHVAPATACSSP